MEVTKCKARSLGNIWVDPKIERRMEENDIHGKAKYTHRQKRDRNDLRNAGDGFAGLTQHEHERLQIKKRECGFCNPNCGSRRTQRPTYRSNAPQQTATERNGKQSPR